MQLEVEGVDIAYGDRPVVRSAGFALPAGHIGCLLGPSGCGKTTLLRAIAGFEPVRAGRIRLAGETVSAPGRTVAPERRGVGMVFQDFALFPHLTVADNIAFGLRDRPAADRRQRVTELLELVGLAGRGGEYPHCLSGGQQQRVALARAMAPCPRLLLLDEPFSSLDVELREGLAREVRSVLQRQGMTALLVTHDQMEAFAMADEIGVMSEGRIHQWDSAFNLYHRPADRFVADFIGQGVLLPGTVLDAERVETALGIIDGGVPSACRPGCPVEVVLRPDDVVDVPADDADATRGRVEAKAFRGADTLYTLRLSGGARVLCQTHSHHDYAIGAEVPLRLETRHLVVFPRKPPAV